MTHRNRIWALGAVGALAIAGMFSVAPFAQDLAYHDFADQRALFGIANFGNVMSNLAFAVVGVIGMVATVQKRGALKSGVFLLGMAFFAGIFLVAFGSAYYHLSPDNDTLVWDRLPMTIVFTSLLSIVLLERVDEKWGVRLYPLFQICGIVTVLYWDYTEGLGRGDLRPYALVQFLPILAILVMMALFPPKFAGSTKTLAFVLGWYGVAKLVEHFDEQIFLLTGNLASGHTLKHLAAAAAAAYLVGYVKAGERQDPGTR